MVCPNRNTVYPRVCGGTHNTYAGLTHGGGLSPRVRGNLIGILCGPGRLGSIPACAGEPYHHHRTSQTVRVYPRVCGGTAAPIFRAIIHEGLSPRVRGNRSSGISPACAARSIPACAGEPNTDGHVAHFETVYPRVCGGTSDESPAQARDQGLSPRVRGNR